MNTEQILQSLPEFSRPLFVDMNNQIVTLQQELFALRRLHYGQKTEQHIQGLTYIQAKGTLFDEVEQIQESEPTEPEAPAVSDTPEPKDKKPKRTTNQGGRQPLPAHLPRERIVHEPKSKLCAADGSELKHMGEVIVEKLEFTPATLKVIEHVYPKYSCGNCQSNIVQAPSEPCILPKTQCGPTLLSQIILFKYLLAVPLYRQESEFAAMGLEISRTSMARWVIGAHQTITPLLDLLKQSLLSQSVLHADETHVQVLKEPGKQAQSKFHMWTLCASKNQPPAVWFEYFDSRRADCADKLLENFNGLLHCDGYPGYNHIVGKNKITQIGCWAHVRRKFDAAKKDGTGTHKNLASRFLDLIQKMFLAERAWRELSVDDHTEQRKQVTKPIIDEIKALLDRHRGLAPPSLNMGRALTYLFNQWDSLIVCATDARAELSNNRMENFIRPFAIGRKNWMFCDTPAGANASCGIYSLLLTAKANELKIRPYLDSVFTKIPLLLAEDPNADLTPYLPWNWKKTHLQIESKTQS